MNKYKVPVSWRMEGIMNIEANSIEAAILMAEDLETDLPDADPIPDSFTVDVPNITSETKPESEIEQLERQLQVISSRIQELTFTGKSASLPPEKKFTSKAGNDRYKDVKNCPYNDMFTVGVGDSFVIDSEHKDSSMKTYASRWGTVMGKQFKHLAQIGTKHTLVRTK